MGQSTWINMRLEEKGNNVNLRRLLSKKEEGAIILLFLMK